MPICKICHVERQLKPLNERTGVIGFPIKTWHCEKCGFKRWPLNKEEYEEWDKLYEELMKKPKEKKKTDCVFYSLLDREDKNVTRRHHVESPGGCGDCSCDDESSGGDCSGGGCSGGGCSGGGCGS